MPVSIGDKIAYLFPGQGSQAVGMGKKLYSASPASRAVFDEVDDALGLKLSSIMFEGPADVLTRTENAQPAIAAVSLAVWKTLEEVTGSPQAPDMAAGHSLGEYTALAVAGVLSISDVVRLVAQRGRFMQGACDDRPGGMAALIGIDEITAEEVCRETGAYTSNINAPGQINYQRQSHGARQSHRPCGSKRRPQGHSSLGRRRISLRIDGACPA